MSKVFVTDGRSISALAVARSLGEKGIDVHCGDEFSPTITSYSKYVSKNVKYPSASSSPDEFFEYLSKLSVSEEYNLIIPTRDETTLLLAKRQSELPDGTDVYLADYETIQQLEDKGTTMKLAERCGVSIPETYYPDETGIDDIAARIEYPALIKPRRSSGSRGIEYVQSQKELVRKYEQVSRDYENPIIQEFVSHDGAHYSIGTVFDRQSEPVAVHAYEELKQYPSSGGPAVNAKTVPVEPWVDGFLDMLREVAWIGPAHMDVLIDPNGNVPKLLEVNPRLWTSLNLTVRSGVDVPYLIYQLANGLKIVEQIEQYETGLMYRWVLPNEILWVMDEDRKTEAVRGLSSPFANHTCYGILSSDDPLATVGVFAQSIRFLVDKEKRSTIFNRGW